VFFYTRVFLQSAFFAPAPPPTGSFFHALFFTQCTFFLSLSHMRYIHGSFLQSVFFFLRPPRQLVVFFTQCTFFLPPLHAVFYTGIFLQSASFPPAPPPTGSFFTLGFFYTIYVFSRTPTCGFLYGNFLTECFFPLAPLSTGSFFLTPGFLHILLFSPSLTRGFLT
jgi:hypothetical protein